MKKLLFMMLAVVMFAGCSKEDSTVLSEGDKITRSIKPTNTALINILVSAQCWEECRTFVYSEPDGKGEELAIFDAEVDWKPYEALVFSNEQLIKYIPRTKQVQTNHYYDFDITSYKDNTISFMRNSEEYYMKFLAYNEDYIWVETNCYDVDKNYQKQYGRADSYPYVRILYKNIPANAKFYPEGYLSEEEITPLAIEYPVELPENFFEIAEGTSLWKQDVGYYLVYDKNEILFDNDNLLINKGLGKRSYYNTKHTAYPKYYWYKFVDGMFYQIKLEHKVNKEGLGYVTLTIKKCETPENHLLGFTENGQIIVTEQNYNILFEKPYLELLNETVFNTVDCYYISEEKSEDDIALLKAAYEDPSIEKIYTNFSD